jgi:hypothetical protein
MKRGWIIAIVIIIILIIVGAVLYINYQNKIKEEFRERGLAEGVPEICLDRGYDQTECSNFCEENPADCGREERG